MAEASRPHPRPALVAVAGDNDCASADPRYREAVRLGRALVDAGYHVLTGGGGGIMEAVAYGALAALHGGPGTTLGILPGGDPKDANPYVDLVIPTGMGLARNAIVAHAPAVIGVGGRAGTLSELALAWQLGRLVVGFRTDGWSGRLAGEPVDDRVRIPSANDDRVFEAADSDEVVRILARHYETYAGRPPPRRPPVLYGPQPYEALDHTADAGIEVEGDTAENCMARLILAFGAFAAGPAESLAPLVERRTVICEGPDRAFLAVAVLSEVADRIRSGRVPVAAAVEELSESATCVRVGFVPRPEASDEAGIAAEIKAVTHHGARFEAVAPDRYVARIVVDV
ncbi:MAG: hypothetical protein D6705_00885 [Deltaproteobacteria bacterium]|nr:MAG: hypothetical protein D6705_00885 [Deltaproteobacteria bacterium]